MRTISILPFLSFGHVGLCQYGWIGIVVDICWWSILRCLYKEILPFWCISVGRSRLVACRRFWVSFFLFVSFEIWACFTISSELFWGPKVNPPGNSNKRQGGCGTGKGAFDINSLIGFLCLSSPCLVWIRRVGFVWWWSFISFFFFYSLISDISAHGRPDEEV